MDKNKKILVIVSLVGLVVAAAVALLFITKKTATPESVAPTAPRSKPQAATCSLQFTVAGTPTPTPSPTPTPPPGKGSLTVCKAITLDGVSLEDWSQVPQASFSIEIGADPTVQTDADPRAVEYGKTPTALTFSSSETPSLDSALGAAVVCKSYGSDVTLPTDGSSTHLTYKEEVISPNTGWETPVYADGGNGAASVSTTHPYTAVLFDGDLTNDADREKGSDGDVSLSLAKPTRTILIVNAYTTQPTPTPTPSVTPTPAPACNSSCVTDQDCPSDLICTSNQCRRPGCTAVDTCVCGPEETPTPTPTASCNTNCLTDADCPTDLTCAGGSCRNASCSTETSCVCPVPVEIASEPPVEQPLPVSGITLPTIGLIGTGAVTIIIGILGLLVL